MKSRLLFIFLITLMIIPSVSAESDSYYFRKIIDLLYDFGSFVAEKTIQYIYQLFEDATHPILSLAEKMLKAEVSVSIYYKIWRSMAYVVSLFYGILFMYAGLKFITSGDNPANRENAKTWLKNIIVMIVLVASSFYLYQLLMQLSVSLTDAVLSMTRNNFFYMTYDNFANFSMELLFVTTYILILLITVWILSIRYVFASIGVVFMPIAIFLYFIPPLKSYGKLILNSLGIMAFIPFIDAVIILTASELLYVSVFYNMQILVKIVTFLIINFVTIYLIRLAVSKSAFDKTSDGVTSLIKHVL